MMSSFIYVLLSFHFINRISSETTAPVVDTPLGVIVGSYEESHSGRLYEAFRGIPYALPPTKERRFKPPVPITKSSLIDATKRVNPCIHYSYQQAHHTAKIFGIEDCLYLNIFSPVYDKRQLLPVIFSIHGGAYTYGSAFNDVSDLMDRDVIFVSINYRLGIFGFLSTEDEHISGNMGLKDQSMALRWTFENIEYFGGDPKRITLFGNSAGASSVHFHYLSPLSKGLFQNGISLSGSSLSAGNTHKRSLQKFKKVAFVLHCPVENILEAVECLQGRPARDIVLATRNFLSWHFSPMVPFGPVVEKHSTNSFIDRSPIDIISSGDAADVLWMTNIVSGDGLYPGVVFIVNATLLEHLNKNWNIIAPNLLMYYWTIPTNEHDYYSTLIRNKYFGKEQITEDNVEALISLLGHRLYCSGSIRAAKLQAKKNHNPVLFWYYNYRALTSFTDYLTKDKNNFGVCHTDDLFMIINNPIICPQKTEEDRAVQIKLTDMVISVATEGYPNIDENMNWKRVKSNKESLNILHFASSIDIQMEKEYNLCENEFWDAINDVENLLS